MNWRWYSISSFMHNAYNLYFPPKSCKAEMAHHRQSELMDTGKSFSAKRCLLGSLKRQVGQLGAGIHFVSSLCLNISGRSQSLCRWTRGLFGTLSLSMLSGSRGAHELASWFQDSDSPERRPCTPASWTRLRAEGRGSFLQFLSCFSLSESTGKKISVQFCEFLLQAGWEAAS